MLQTQQQPALNKYLLIKICISIKYNKKDKNTRDYLLGGIGYICNNRKMIT